MPGLEEVYLGDFRDVFTLLNLMLFVEVLEEVSHSKNGIGILQCFTQRVLVIEIGLR